MTSDRETLGVIGSWMEDGRTRLPEHVLDAVLEQLPATPQRRPRWPAWRIPRLTTPARLSVAAVAIAVVSLVGLSLLRQPAVIGPVASPSATPTIAPSQTFEPSPATTPEASVGLGIQVPCVAPASEMGVVLGCSRDGTRLLIQKDNQNLFVLNADGSEAQVTTQLTGFNDIVGSGRPAGATISPDGGRVVFAGLTEPYEQGKNSCHNGALFGVDADGGPAKVLFTSQVQQNGIVRYPRFSPDGTRIAVADGYCDSSHGVWVMDADGTDAHQIVPTDFGPLGATHVHDLVWSKTGDRIAIVIDDGAYAFAPDGSGFARLTNASDFCFMTPQC
jgi:Tol biopolymer transport system component